MKQITIYEFLKRNADIMKDDYVAYDPTFGWLVFIEKPTCENRTEGWDYGTIIDDMYNIAPFDGDWRDSLIKVEHKEEE